jgi:hypothetical protein
MADSFVAVAASALQCEALVLQCKRRPAMLDSVHGLAAHLECSAGCLGQRNLVDINSCSARCGRCGVTLGDAAIETDEQEATDTSLSLGDIGNVRLPLHTVSLNGADPVQLQRVVARSLLHLTRVHGCSAFRVPTGLSDARAWIGITVLHSKYQVAVAISPHLTMADALKVAFEVSTEAPPSGEKRALTLSLTAHEADEVT